MDDMDSCVELSSDLDGIIERLARELVEIDRRKDLLDGDHRHPPRNVCDPMPNAGGISE
jgi:hypothetical protein